MLVAQQHHDALSSAMEFLMHRLQGKEPPSNILRSKNLPSSCLSPILSPGSRLAEQEQPRRLQLLATGLATLGSSMETSSGAAVFVFDFAEPVALEAAKDAVKQFASLFVATSQRPGSSLKLGLCALSKPAHAPKVQLLVKQRPTEVSLRDVHAALGKVQCGTSCDSTDGAQAAMALQTITSMVGSDRELAAAQRRAVVILTDRQYEASDFQLVMQLVKEKGLQLELYFTCAAGGMEAAAGGWTDLETQYPANLSVAVVETPGREAFRGLAALFLERYSHRQHPAVSLQFKVPLVGEVRALQLSARPAMLRLSSSVEHAPICPCHKLPGLQGPKSALCAVSGDPITPSSMGKDPRTIQIGQHPGGVLHFASSFTIAVEPSGQAALSVVQRVKRDDVNPACMFGTPMLLASKAGQFKVAHEGELLDISIQQLLQSLASSLREAGELLIASTTTDLESGQPGLFRQFYAISPDASGQTLLHAVRIVTAEELPAPAAGRDTQLTALPAPLAEAVRQQLSQVQLGPFDPLVFSSRCHETLEMLVLQSRPLPKPQPLLPPAKQPPVVPLAAQPSAAAAAAAAAEPPAPMEGDPTGAGGVATAAATPSHRLPPTVPSRAKGSGQQPALQPAVGKGRRAQKQAAGQNKRSGRGGLELQQIQR